MVWFSLADDAEAGAAVTAERDALALSAR